MAPSIEPAQILDKYLLVLVWGISEELLLEPDEFNE
jgi:hypothetical protein